MSYDTWRRKYYPTEARDVPKQKAAAYSLLKWEGLRPEVLADHGLRLTKWGALIDADAGDAGEPSQPHLQINHESCAFCTHYLWPLTEQHAAGRCDGCPLAVARNGTPCDQVASRSEGTSPYHESLRSGDPEPMIQCLKMAVAHETIRHFVDSKEKAPAAEEAAAARRPRLVIRPLPRSKPLAPWSA